MSGDGRRGGGPELPPMTILGEDRPDVEDTTVGELRAQQEQLEQARRDLADRTRQERERAAQQLAAERRRAERELARRQREIDDAERRLLRTERRLRRQGAGSGASVDLTPTTRRRRRSRRADDDLLDAARAEASTRVPRLWLAATLALAAGLSLALGSALSAERVERGQTGTLTVLDTAQADLRDAVSVLDTELVRYATGEPVPLDGAGQLPSVTTAQEVLARDGLDPFAAERLAEVEPALASDTVSPVRAATVWRDTRLDMAYAVSSWDVERELEAMRPGSALGTTLLWAGGLLLAVGAVVLLRAGARVAGAFVALAALATSLLVVQDTQPGWREAVTAHEDATDRPGDLQRVVQDDLQVLVGLRSVEPWEADDEYGYWNQHYALEEGSDPDGTVAQVRADLGRTLAQEGGQEAQRTAALDLVAAADAARAPLEADLVTAREAVVAEATTGPSTALLAAGLGLAVLLPFAGLGAESIARRRKEEA